MALKYHLSFYLIFSIYSLSAQESPRFFDLNELLELAATNALELSVSNSFLKESALQVALLEEQQKPQVLVNATLPNLSRSIESRPLPDGRDAFVNRSTMYNSVGIRMDYQLASTGGTIYARSGLDRLDILKTAHLAYSRNYFFTPISLGIHQPLFQFNEARWQKEKNHLLNKEVTTRQFFIREEVIQKTLLKYAEAFLAQLKLSLAEQKVVESDSLFKIKQRLFAIGKASKVEILRLELELASNGQGLEQAQLDWEIYKMALCDYLNLGYEMLQGLNPPPPIQNINIDPEEASNLALHNAYQLAHYKRRLREAETKIEIAEKDKGILFDINASLGLSKSSENLNKIAQKLEDQQTISLGIAIPLTGGRGRAINRDIAQEQLFREQTDIRQEKIDLTRTVTTDVKSYILLNKNIALNKKAMEVAFEIYHLTSQQYLLGNHTITELNIAGAERDQTLLQYYRSILDATLKYYEIRKNCLYDFVENKSLVRAKN